MTVELTTFGYKSGAPLGADLTVDVRSLPNPFYEPELKALTGCDAAIAAFFRAKPGAAQSIETFKHDVRKEIADAKARGAATVRVAIGCTGGQHRSVFVAERVAEDLRADGFEVRIVHRELASR